MAKGPNRANGSSGAREEAAGDMTVWAEGSGSYTDETRFRTITAREFVRRFRHAVTRQETSFVWFLGAGCSVSSGIPAADEAVRSWLKDLKYLETGQEADLEAWACKRFVGYDPDGPGKVYGEVLEALFYTEQDRRRELERMMKAAEPGFGYATLAQLMTHEKWGGRCSVTISTNFDDLAADSLHLYSQRRPQVFTHESLSRRTPISPNAPTVVKIYGDAHLPTAEAGANRPTLNQEVVERLREQMTETGLIIVGYGGRDEAVLDLLEGMPSGAPAGGVFWVNSAPPMGAMAEWLESRQGIWVSQGDFDELMFHVRGEFGLGHPKIERFERILRKYEAQYRELSTRAGLSLSETPAEDGGLPEGGLGINAPNTLAARRATPESQRERLRQSLNAFSKVAAGPAQSPAKSPVQSPAQTPGKTADATAEPSAAEDGADTPADAAPERIGGNVDALFAAAARELQRGRPRAADAAMPITADRGASAPKDAFEDADMGAEPDAQEPAAPPPAAGAAPTPSPASDSPLAPAAIEPVAPPPPAKAAMAMAQTVAGADDAALPPEPIAALPSDQVRAGVAAFTVAIQARPNDPALRRRFARFLATGARDSGRAEQTFEAALELAPDDVASLRDYADFAIVQLQDAPRAEQLLTKALNLDLRNAETLRALAGFLLRARGDLDEAENCFRLAIEVAPDTPENLIAYARFLEERRGRREAADAYLRRAAEAEEAGPRAFAELAVFRAGQVSNFHNAEKMMRRAVEMDAEDAVVAYSEAVLAERQGDLDRAEAAFERAIARDPREMRAQLAYAQFLKDRRRDLEAADAQHQRAIAASPDLAEPLSAYAMFLEEVRGDADAAEGRHREAIELEPYNPLVLAAFAEHLGRRREMIDEADALFRDALRLSPRAARILRAYGRFLDRARGDADNAETYLRRAVEMDPHSVEALDDLAQFLHVVRQDVKEAEVFFREALRLAPDRSDTLNRFAAFLRDSRRDLEEAETCYRRALERNPKDASTLSRAAQFLLAEGRRGEGLKLLNDAFDAAWSMDPTVRPNWLMLELWIYRYAHDPARRDESLKAARALIQAGARSEGWDLGPTVEQAVAAGHPNPDLLRALAAVATDGADPAELEPHLA